MCHFRWYSFYGQSTDHQMHEDYAAAHLGDPERWVTDADAGASHQKRFWIRTC